MDRDVVMATQLHRETTRVNAQSKGLFLYTSTNQSKRKALQKDIITRFSPIRNSLPGQWLKGPKPETCFLVHGIIRCRRIDKQFMRVPRDLVTTEASFAEVLCPASRNPNAASWCTESSAALRSLRPGKGKVLEGFRVGD
jgi:hypothetical protein